MNKLEQLSSYPKNIWISTQIITLCAIVALSFSSCEKFLNIDPPKDKATSEQMFENDQIATAAITGIYSRMIASGPFSGGNSSVATLTGLSSDELKPYNLSLNAFYRYELTSSTSELQTFWSGIYTYIYTANAILDAIRLSNKVTESTKRQLEGEAKFVRAFSYFYLVNLFGNVPLNLTTDYRVNEVMNRTPKEKIYIQIVSDLTDAENLLLESYVTTERVRPNKFAAKALLSRVYLYTEKWDLAIQKASEVIDEKTLYSLGIDLDKVFLKNSTETIWQIMPGVGLNTNEGALFVLTTTPSNVSMTPEILSLFVNGDNRRTQWIGEYTNSTGTYYFPYKYKVRATVNGAVNEYSMILRLAEMHLIRAEARAKVGQKNLSLEDLNLIRKRAGLTTPLTGLSEHDCILEVEKQRRLELFSEWGQRWLDLKRTNRATTVLAPLKGQDWQETHLFYPIPDNELSR